MPYSPPEYKGPNFDEWHNFTVAESYPQGMTDAATGATLPPGDYDILHNHRIGIPKQGYGLPMSYIYALPTGMSGSANNLYKHRSFGAMGAAATAT